MVRLHCFVILILIQCITSTNTYYLHGNGISEELLPSYLDVNLWYNASAKTITYNKTEHRYVVKNINVLKFKFEKKVETISTSRRRKRRNVFGADNRFHITPQYVEEFPFQSVVRLSSGCTGTLIWYQHVLTAAHCVHDRERFNPTINTLRIGMLQKDGTFEWYGASKVHVPNSYKKKLGMMYLNHDYAIIKLDRRHGRRWMPFGVYDVHMNNYIQFSGFPSDKPDNQMWYSFCTVSQLKKHTLFNYCDATRGMSGSGVYVCNKNDNQDRKIVAVFSSYVKFKSRNLKGNVYYDANIATRLTAKKVRRICKWMDAGHNCFRLGSMFDGRPRFL